MPTVTGNLSDVGLGHLAGRQREVVFTLNAPNVTGGTVWATKDQRVFVDTNGDFTTPLADTTAMNREAWYAMSVRWQEPGDADNPGYNPVDVHLDTKIVVPPGGGSIGDLLVGGVSNLSMVWVSLYSPPVKFASMLWLQTNPDDVNDARNTYNLYRWEL